MCIGTCLAPGVDPDNPNVSLTQWLELLPSQGDGGEGTCEGTNGTNAELNCILDVNGTAEFSVETEGVAYAVAAGVPLEATSGTANHASAHVEIGVPLDGASIQFVPSSISLPFADDVQVECSGASNAAACGRIVRSSPVAVQLASASSRDAGAASGTQIDVSVQLVPEADSPPGSSAWLSTASTCPTTGAGDSLPVMVDPSVGLSTPFYVCVNGQAGHYLLSAITITGIQGSGTIATQAQVFVPGQPTFVSGTAHVVSAEGGTVTLAASAQVLDCNGSPVPDIQLLPQAAGLVSVNDLPDGGTDDAGIGSFSISAPIGDGGVPTTVAVSLELPQLHTQCTPIVLSVTP